MQTARWELYPLVSENPATRAFIEELAQVRKSPSTIDNYSRDLDDFLQASAGTPFSTLLREAHTSACPARQATKAQTEWSRPL